MATYLDRILAAHREAAAADDRPLEAPARRRALPAAGAGSPARWPGRSAWP
ncbi:MAG: hypothetical protein U0P45_09625 [Acidimicrobiales bacterium]